MHVKITGKCQNLAKIHVRLIKYLDVQHQEKRGENKKERKKRRNPKHVRKLI